MIKEEVTSGDFGNMLPGDSGHKWKDDGDALNKESRSNLKKLGIKIVYAGRKNLEEHLLFLNILGTTLKLQ